MASDLFALGSSLYELVAGHQPYEGEEDSLIEEHFRGGQYPDVQHLLMGKVILGCWKSTFFDASAILDQIFND